MRTQDNPELQSTGWKMLSATPDLNFLSQIVLLLFEDESEPVDSTSRYYVDLHIGSGVKARKQTFNEGVPFIDGQTHSPSFVKRLPTVPAQRGSETNLLPQVAAGVRKVASYPLIHSEPTLPDCITPSPKRKSSYSFSHTPTIAVSRRPSLPDSPGKKHYISYTNESLQTLGEPGEQYGTLHSANCDHTNLCNCTH